MVAESIPGEEKKKKEEKKAIANTVENLTWAFFSMRKFWRLPNKLIIQKHLRDSNASLIDL